MSKYTVAERETVKGIVANLTIKRIPDQEIIREVHSQTGKTLSRSWLYSIRQSIKRDSYKWYSQLKQGEYEYLAEFKSRIREIEDLIKRHYKIIEDNSSNPGVQQTSLAELHKLNITLSNYYDVAPFIVSNIGSKHGNNTLSNSQQDKKDIIV